MGKTGKTLKRRRLAESLLATTTTPTTSTLPSDSDSSNSFLQGLITPEELATTTRTLALLANEPDVLGNSRGELKGLRKVVFDFQRVSNELNGTGTTLTSRISAALASSRYTDALVLLSELRIRNLAPKLGALQRWVRDCDAASQHDGSFGNNQVLRVLDAILRTTVEPSTSSADHTDGMMSVDEENPVRRMEEWAVREPSGVDLRKAVEDGTILSIEERTKLASSFRLLQSTPGPSRLPPNHHPALLYTTSPLLKQPPSTSLLLTPSSSRTLTVLRHSVPNVPAASVLTDVLDQTECRQIIAAAETVGFAPDLPVTASSSVSTSSSDNNSILAHNLYWLTDSDFITTFYDRLKHLLPPILGGGEVKGINRRFRVYRYVPRAIYRPHIDGAWPQSGIDQETGEYLYDECKGKEKGQWSRLTFLLYLNDSFPAGCTTFFTPSTTNGVMNAWPVKPVSGCALVFPHGDTTGSLLHEGSPVGEGGVKYVIRTDVLYETSSKGRKGEDDGAGTEL